MGEVGKFMAYILIMVVILFIFRTYMKRKQKSKEEIRLVTFIVVIMGVSNLVIRLIP